jgi:hypothetical protein
MFRQYSQPNLEANLNTTSLRALVLPTKYSANPAYNRSVMLMAAKHHYGLNGECEWAHEPTFLHHKAEVIRLLKEQIDNNPNNPGEWSFSVIFFLVSMEV